MKNLDPWIDPRLSGVRPAEVRSYLARQGWALKSYPRPELLVFEGPSDDDGKPIVQVLPASQEAADYAQRLLELITALALIEGRPASAVLDDILAVAPQEGRTAVPNGPMRGRPARKP